MAIRYRLEPIRNNINKEGKQGVFPQLIKGETVSIRDLARKICIDSSFSEGDVLGILENMTESIASYLSLGCNVNLDHLGTLSLSATLKNKDIPPNQIRGNNIRVKKVRFRTSPDFMNRLSDTKFVKANESNTPSLPQSPDENDTPSLFDPQADE